MTVGAVVLGDVKIDGLNDSKKLSAKKRASLAIEIKKSARAIGVGWVSSSTIDKIGLSVALKLAAERAVAQINCDYDQIIIDGTIRLIDDPRASVLPRADGLISSVSAASIIAKVARDNYMGMIDNVFDGYNFASHVGYGTATHRAVILGQGVLPIHRTSFAPIAEIISGGPIGHEDKISQTTGRRAEDVATDHLVHLGHEIIAQNWKTKYCEIDIVSRHDEKLYFTEVKYRKIDQWGDGLDVITEKKENQMRFAARFWLQKHRLIGKVDAHVSAISLSGTPPTVEKYLPSV